MKNSVKRTFSILIVCAMVMALLPVLNPVKVHAVTQNQQNIVDRADYFFDSTWVCQKTMYGWRDQYTFTEGETYRLPYGQPVNSGKFIGYGVTLEDFLAAAADVNSVYYSQQSEFNGWTSVYYATDCAAFVAMCWGTVRQDCSTLPYYSTNIGVVSTANLSKIQLGDALDSTTVGHVVLVTDLSYDENGDLAEIEITEQTPPQLKRSYFTPEALVEKYGDEFYIYRYYGDVPEAPVRGYTAQCQDYAAHCNIEITEDQTPIMSLPCSDSVEETSVQIGTAKFGDDYVATRLFVNTEGEVWYRVSLTGSDGFVYAGSTAYKGQILGDITLTGATAPSAHVKGRTFAVNGSIDANYNSLVNASVYIYSGFGISGQPVTGGKDTISSNAYTLASSNIDYDTSFGILTAGQFTYVIAAEYKNYYATSGDTYAMNTGTAELMEEYFVVVNSSVSQSSCAHSYTTTVVDKQTCTEQGITVKACGTCGQVEKIDVDADGHNYGQWTVDEDATCTEDGIRSRVCSVCDNVQQETISAIGHDYSAVEYDTDCQSYAHTTHICANCGDSYNTFPEEIMSPWQSELPEVDASLMESKTQYRYSDYSTTTSYESTLEGYTQIGSEWEAGQSDVIFYVENWPTGFDTTNSLYAKYNNISDKVTATETEDSKITVDSDQVVGYLYYHWCSSTDYYHYSYANKSNTHTIFHAYYSEIDPDNYLCDTSDMSYKTSHSCCSNGNSEWFFVAQVKAQSYTNYAKLYSYERWSDWSDWSDDSVDSTENRKVEEQTVYRYVNAELGDHDYVDGVCSVCGDVLELPKPTLVPSYSTVSFEGQIQMNIYFTVTDRGDLSLEDMGLLTWTAPRSDGTIDNANAVIPGAVTDGTQYMVHSNGIPAKDLGDTIYFRIYAKLSDGSYIYTNMYSTSPKSYAASLLNNPNADERVKALCVAMLNYGAAAQTYFGYKTYTLVNADLTAEQQALVEPYVDTMMDSIVSVTQEKGANFVRSSEAFSNMYATVSFEGAFAINYYFFNTMDVDDTMILYYWTQEDCEKADVLSPENATGSMDMVSDADRYWGEVANIAAKDMDSTVYVAGVYSFEGQTFTTGVIAYSLGAYCKGIAANENSDAQELAAMTAVYGYYAEQYFDSLYG